MNANLLLAFTQLLGGFQQSQAEKAVGKFQQSQANINARFSELQADDIIRRGDKEANDHQKKIQSAVSSQRAALAANGVEVDSGTALDLQLETSEIGALEAGTIRNNAWRQAFGYKQEATLQRIQGRFARDTANTRATQSLITGGLKALGTSASSLKAPKAKETPGSQGGVQAGFNLSGLNSLSIKGSL